jgi:hypothetical protein
LETLLALGRSAHGIVIHHDRDEHFYNFQRPHGAHKGKTPYEILRERLTSQAVDVRGPTAQPGTSFVA